MLNIIIMKKNTMTEKLFWLLVFGLLFSNKVFGNFTTPSSSDDDDDWDDEDDSSEIEDEGNDGYRVYKNPRNSPSTLCPRDEEQATLLGQKCLRKCSSDEDCKSKKKKCLCDGACGMSCIKPDRECPEPEQISFGTVIISGKLFGARASYSCEHGYHVVGLQSRTCQADGQWAGQAPACKQNIYCLSPPTIDHARHNALPEQATFDLDSTLQYYCYNGYVTNGFPRAKCLAIDGQASWYGPDISCEPRSCGTPTDISHGWHAGECYTFGCRIMYHCAEGYELVGKTERFCQSDGTWTPKELPSCVLVTAVQCPSPENPRHGKAIYTSCSYNSVVRYECKYGYTLVGESTRRCGADRRWSGIQPVCKEINCGHPGRLWNGWLENIEGGTGLGASIIFRCHEGMLLEGNSSTVCQIDGKWRYALPKCLAPCVVPHISKGRVILLSRNDTAPTSTVVTHGEILAVDCDARYEFISQHPNVTCNNGTWTQMPKCEPAKCQELPKPPRHGMVSAPDMKHGMRAKFRCKDGYELRGYEFVECAFGNWTGTLPRCEEVFCPYPGMVENGKILLVGNMGLYDYRPYVKKVANNKQIMYDCEKGYVLLEGPPGATCVGGRWSPQELPKCVLAEHPRFRWNRRRRRSVPVNKKAFLKKYIQAHNGVKKRINNVLDTIMFLGNRVPVSGLKWCYRPVSGLKKYYRPNIVYVKKKQNKLKFKRDTKTFKNYNFEHLYDNKTINALNNFGNTNNKMQQSPNSNSERKKKYLSNASVIKKPLQDYNLAKNNLFYGSFEYPIYIDYLKYKNNLSSLKRYTKRQKMPNMSLKTSYLQIKFLKNLYKSSLNKHYDNILQEEYPHYVNEMFKGHLRLKRALKGGGSSRAVGSIHKSSGSSLSLRRGHKGKNSFEDLPNPENEITPTKKPKSYHTKSNKARGGPCEPLQDEPFVNIEFIKHGKDQNATFGPGTIVRLACGKGYILNMAENKTAKCIKGKWKPKIPMCNIGRR